MQDTFDLTRIEVADIMKYLKALIRNFETLSRSFSTECFVELRKSNTKKLAAKKAGGVLACELCVNSVEDIIHPLEKSL